MDGLDVSKLPMDLLLNILNIILLFLITRTLVYKPVKKFMQERKERIENEKAQVSKEKEEAEEIKSDYEEKLALAEENARQAVIESEAQAKKKASEIIDEAQKQAEAIRSDARLQAQKEKQKALDSMKDDVASLAISISEKILSRQVNNEDNDRIINEFLKSGDEK